MELDLASLAGKFLFLLIPVPFPKPFSIFFTLIQHCNLTLQSRADQREMVKERQRETGVI